MELAKHVQEDLIPDAPPDVHGLKSIGWTHAASITGGDCFDLWRLDDGRLGIFVGDASATASDRRGRVAGAHAHPCNVRC